MFHEGIKRQLDGYSRIEYHDLPACPEDGITGLRFQERHDGLLARGAYDLTLAQHAGARARGLGDEAAAGWGSHLRLRHNVCDGCGVDGMDAGRFIVVHSRVPDA